MKRTDVKKVKAVEKTNEEEAKALKVIKKHNTELDDLEMISDCLSKHFFMRILDKRARQEIVKDGILIQSIDNVQDKEYHRGESLGELALIHSSPRAGTLIAKTKCSVWCLERKNFRKIVDVINKMNYEENKNFISSIRMLSSIDNELKSILSSNLLNQYFEKGAIIFKGKLT